MTLLLLGSAALALLVWLGRRSGGRSDWRPAGAVLALGLLTGAAVLAIRSQWLSAALFAAAAAAVAVATRRRGRGS